MNQTVDILCRARALYASAPSHAPVQAYPESGTNCVIFALEFAEPGASKPSTPTYRAVEREMGQRPGGVAEWNATHSTEEVLAAFDRAITAQRLRVPGLQPAATVRAGQES